MAFYDYKCKDCKKIFEISKGMNDKTEPSCPHCKSKKTSRVFTSPRRGASLSNTMDHEGSESSGSCSSCTSGVCSSCGTKGQ